MTLQPSSLAALDRVLRSWLGTPWRAGQCGRGQGVDCRYFIVAVLDELCRIETPRPPRLPQDSGVNGHDRAWQAIRELAERYQCRTLAAGEAPEPGDVLILRRASQHADALQHGMIFGPRGEVWHAGLRGVMFTALAGWNIRLGFRPAGKDQWI
jgi:cell wall-associated NlpC family hydrolase